MSTVQLPVIPKPKREDVPKDKVLCEFCTAKCCRYFALPIDLPETIDEWEFVRWYLLHDAATVFQDEGSWYLLVHTTCKHLRADNLCGIYETRPQICRDYTTENCEFEDDWVYDKYLETAEQVWEYSEAMLRSDGPHIRSPKPELLPVLS